MLYDYLLDSADNIVSTYVFGAWEAFNNVANSWITIMLALYIVVMGYMVWLGRVNTSFADLMPRIFKMAVIYVLVTNVALLTTFVYETFVDIPPSIVNTLYTSFGENESSIDQSMGKIYKQGLTAAEQISKYAGYNVIIHAYAALVGGLTVALVTVAAGYIVLAKLAVAVLLALAPFFILLYLFAGTKSLFEGWLRQILTFALIPILVYSLLILIVTFMDEATKMMVDTTVSAVVKFGNVATYSAICGVCLLLLTQVMAWAAGIAGGFQLSSLGMFKNSASGSLSAMRGANKLRQRWDNYRNRTSWDKLGAKK